MPGIRYVIYYRRSLLQCAINKQKNITQEFNNTDTTNFPGTYISFLKTQSARIP